MRLSGWLASVLCLCTLIQTGCSSYTLRGRVVQGNHNGIVVVAPDDPRLQGPGAADIRITIERDPNKGWRKQVGSSVSNPDGWFDIPVDAFGAGWMDEFWGVFASGPGYESHEEYIRLPGSPKHGMILVTLHPGIATPPKRPDDLMRQYEQYR